jgi:DNA-binding GntR family transcriptional regulator
MRSVHDNTGPIPRPEPLRASVYRRVVRLMTDGELEPGQTLTEAGLSKALGVSRTPVREALLQLEAEGVLQSTPARGFTVRDLSTQEASELFPILAALEGLAVRTTAPDQFDVEQLREIDERFATAQDPITRWKLDTALHEAMVAACPNQSLRALITRLRVTMSRYEIEYMRRVDTWKHTTDTRHTAILDALHGHDLERAAEAIWQNWAQSLVAVRTWLTPND